MYSDFSSYAFTNFDITYSTFNDGIDYPRRFDPIGNPTYVSLEHDRYGWVAAGLNVGYCNHYSLVTNGSSEFTFHDANDQPVITTVMAQGDDNIFHKGFAAFPSGHKFYRMANNNFTNLCVVPKNSTILRYENHTIAAGNLVNTNAYANSTRGYVHVVSGTISIDQAYNAGDTALVDVTVPATITATSDANVVVIVEY